jgi:hypothetical protein
MLLAFIILVWSLNIWPIKSTSSNAYFIPLGGGIPYVFNNIPFLINASMLTGKYEGMLSVYHTFAYKEVSTINLTGYVVDKVHILQYCSYADNVPDGVVVGHINLCYMDGALTTLDLIIGVNTAEWAYDRPELQPYLQHTKITPAYSFWTNIDSSYYYWGHMFYVMIDTELKPISYIQLILDPKSYTGQKYYGYSYAEWFKIDIAAITLETPIIPSTIDIDPSTLNLKSGGKWIIAYIELPKGYDVSDINRTTVLLNGTIPVDPFWVNKTLESVIGDYDNDTIPDLMVKFDRASVSSYILSQNITYGNVTLTITGMIADMPFEGSCVICVRMPGDIDCNGIVNIFDIVVIAKAYGSNIKSKSWNPAADENEDGRIDVFDLVIAARNYGKTYK